MEKGKRKAKMHRFASQKKKLRRSSFKKTTNISPYWRVIERIINRTDIVLEILDARMPELSRNERIKELIDERQRKEIIVLNKADLVSKKVIEKVKKEYSKIAPTVVVSSRNKKGLNELRSKIYQIGGKVSEDSNIVVGVLGYPNVGKSSVINALAFKKKVAVSKTAGTTHGEQKIKITDRLKVYDSPGVIPLLKFDNLRIGLIGARNPNKLTNLEYVATEIISMFLKRNKKAIEEFYRLKISSKDPYEALFEIGKKKGHMKKGGEVEEQRTSTMIINDWQQGKLRL